MKFAGTVHAEKIRLAQSPDEAAKLGHVLPHRHDWKQIKYDVMRQAVLHKFKTHASIRQILLATEEEKIVQKDLHDYYWGYGKDGSGKNYLGEILMEVRSSLRHYKSEIWQERLLF